MGCRIAKASSLAKKSATRTGPVMTLLDLVVHVPVNCGSVFADTRDMSMALTPSDNGRDRIIKYGCAGTSAPCPNLKIIECV